MTGTGFERYDESRVRQVDCPHCGVRAGTKCRTARGKITAMHTARKAVVYEQYRGKRRGVKRVKHKTEELECARCKARPSTHPGHGPYYALEPPACAVCLQAAWELHCAPAPEG